MQSKNSVTQSFCVENFSSFFLFFIASMNGAFIRWAPFVYAQDNTPPLLNYIDNNLIHNYKILLSFISIKEMSNITFSNKGSLDLLLLKLSYD